MEKMRFARRTLRAACDVVWYIGRLTRLLTISKLNTRLNSIKFTFQTGYFFILFNVPFRTVPVPIWAATVLRLMFLNDISGCAGFRTR